MSFETSEPLVSVLIPVFNEEKHLRSSVLSILNQDYTNIEVIIVDDGSTDCTPEILNQISLTDSRVVVLRKENSGIVDTLNLGLEHCSGRYLARMDGDDLSRSTRFSEQVRFLEQNSHIIGCGSWIKKFGDEVAIVKFPFSPERVRSMMSYANPIAHPTLMVRMSIIHEEAIRYSSKYKHLEDYDLYNRLLRYGELSNIPKVLVDYRIGDNITRVADKQKDERVANYMLLYGDIFRREFGETVDIFLLKNWIFLCRLELGLSGSLCADDILKIFRAFKQFIGADHQHKATLFYVILKACFFNFSLFCFSIGKILLSLAPSFFMVSFSSFFDKLKFRIGR